jgi:hypothetical protein
MTESAANPDGRIESSHLHVDPEDEVLWEVVRSSVRSSGVRTTG